MVRIYCDFDGTVCPQDIGEQLFRAFVGKRAEEIVQELLRGEISAQEWLRRECELIPSITPEVFEQFTDGYTVDPNFPEFVRFCDERGLALVVVSDGLDAYVGRVLAKAEMNHLPYFANEARFVSEDGCGKLRVSFPYTDSECNRCGNCKRNHMLTQSAEEDIIVYVGDGYSDRCPVRYADIVFARRQLIRHCQEQNITYHEFRHFGDVRARMIQVLGRRRIKHRREAVMARQEVFRQG